MKNLKKNLSFVMLVLGLVALLVGMTVTTTQTALADYTKSYTVVTVNSWGNYIRFSHTFSAVTDTVYMNFKWDRPGSVSDTMRLVNIKTTAADSAYVTYTYQYSDDGTNWSTASALGIDSSATAGTTYRTITNATGLLGYYQPYSRIVAIGGDNSGIANSVGAGLQVNIIDP